MHKFINTVVRYLKKTEQNVEELQTKRTFKIYYQATAWNILTLSYP